MEVEQSCLTQKSTKAKTLIIPDGNWSQAARIAQKILKELPCTTVSLQSPPSSQYLLRKNPNLNKISTFEATVHGIKQALSGGAGETSKEL